MLEASFVVPIYNEASLVTENTCRLREYIAERLDRYEIILVENGSVDDTAMKAEQLHLRFPEVRVLSLPEPSLGEALKKGITEALFDNVVYFPIDLSVDMSFIPESLRLLRGCDVVVGSKRLGGGNDHRSPQRRTLSYAYHALVRVLFNTGLSDTTCVKAIRRGAMLELLSRVPSSSQVFETELMLMAQSDGLRVSEIPVTVNDDRSSRQPVVEKVRLKLRDLLTLRAGALSFMLGVPLLVLGLLAILILTVSKLRQGTGGFFNPYSFLLSILLVVSGLQFLFFGLLANMILQIRGRSG